MLLFYSTTVVELSCQVCICLHEIAVVLLIINLLKIVISLFFFHITKYVLALLNISLDSFMARKTIALGRQNNVTANLSKLLPYISFSSTTFCFLIQNTYSKSTDNIIVIGQLFSSHKHASGHKHGMLLLTWPWTAPRLDKKHCVVKRWSWVHICQIL